ncbi:hypothetical protein FRC01_013081 [Tulasnella sp. 417]|nr:hypothetical protein FRC01_013081 [Tulasnella sp. 417]
MDWEALLGDKFISDAELASIELPAMTLSPTKRSLSQEQSSKGKGKAKAVPSPTKPPKSKSVTIVPSNQDSSIIGSKKFAFDQELLTKHIVAAIEFWESKREPRGVDLEDTWKCDTCEFREGCEWREAKAAEMARSRRR